MKTKKEKTQKEEKQADANPILSAIERARRESKPRGFTQTWDFIVNVRGLNLKKPENRFSVDVNLPKGRGREPKIAVFAENMATEASKIAQIVIRKDEVPGLAKDRKRLAELLACDIFLGEAPLMAMVGKELGPTLAPKGKMPKPIPPNVKLDAFAAAMKRSIKVALRESPAIHTAIGNDRMPDGDIAANADAVFHAVKEKLPKGLNNVRSVCIKLTMGKPIKIVMR
jgi:large subunit ribosomal protein L1